MKKLMKKSMAILLTLVVLSGSMVCLAATEAEAKQYDYSSYVLLGDSIASGWSDVEDLETRFTRVEGSYGDLVAKDLGIAEENYYPMACIGFRTVEMRYILEDDFEGDKYLYYSIDNDLMDNVHAPAMRKAIAETDLITLNIGGNDWGSFLGWHVFDELDKAEAENEEFLAQLEEYLTTADFISFDTVATIASYCNALPDLIRVLPQALDEGLTNYFVNWNYMIEDIYALNPDVTLLVIGMFDNSLQDPDSPHLSNDGGINTTNVLGSLGQTIVDIANIPMVEGAKKYGYTFVDTTGTLCEEHHPSRTENGGHRFIANKILEALPDSSFPYEDVEKGTKAYSAIQYMYKKGIMEGTSETTFSPDEKITAADLERALFNLTGKENLTGSSKLSVTRVALGLASYRASIALSNNIMGFANAVSIMLTVIFEEGLSGIASAVTRAEVAETLMYIINK